MNSLRRRMVLIGFIPAFVASLILAAIFLWHSAITLQAALDDQGKRLAHQIAPMQEYPLFTGNEELLRTQLRSSLQLAPEVVRIEVIRRDYSRAAMVERDQGKNESANRYRAPILASYSGIEDYAELLKKELDPSAQVLGWIELTLSEKRAQAELFQRYLWLSLSLLVAFIVAYILGQRLARGLVQPIHGLLEQTQHMEQGEYAETARSMNPTPLAPYSDIHELSQLQRALARLARVLRHREEENRAALEALRSAQAQTVPARASDPVSAADANKER